MCYVSAHKEGKDNASVKKGKEAQRKPLVRVVGGVDDVFVGSSSSEPEVESEELESSESVESSSSEMR